MNCRELHRESEALHASIVHIANKCDRIAIVTRSEQGELFASGATTASGASLRGWGEGLWWWGV